MSNLFNYLYENILGKNKHNKLCGNRYGLVISNIGENYWMNRCYDNCKTAYERCDTNQYVYTKNTEINLKRNNVIITYPDTKHKRCIVFPGFITIKQYNESFNVIFEYFNKPNTYGLPDTELFINTTNRVIKVNIL